MKTGLMLLLAALFCITGRCDDAARARVDVHLEPPGDIRIGQSARLVVEIWVTTWFLQAPQLPDLKIDGAAVTLPDAADHIQEQKDGMQWFGIRRTYVVTATQPGELHVPPLEISVHPGPDGGAQTLRTAALDIKVTGSAAGAGSSLVATQLDLAQQIQTSARRLKVGGSITRTLTQTATGAQAMRLPPLQFEAIDGLTLYPAPPRVESLDDGRGNPTGGRRIDSATYVAQKAGNYTLPAVQVHWWDSSAQTLRTANATAATIKVAPNPQTRPEFATPVEHRFPTGIYSYVLLFFTVLLISALLWYAMYLWMRYWPRPQARLRQWRVHRENSEAHAWRQLHALKNSRNPKPVYRALTTWVTRLPGAVSGPAEFAARCGDEILAAQVTRLEQTFYADSDNPWSATTLIRRCKPARRNWLRQRCEPSRALRPLNPD